MSRSYRLILAAARAIIAEADRLDAPKPVPARTFAPAPEPAPKPAAADDEADFDPSDPSLLMNILLPKGMADFLSGLAPEGFDAPSSALYLRSKGAGRHWPPVDAFEDPATIQPGTIIEAQAIALAEPEPESEPESDPHKSYDFDCPPVVPELDLNHPAQAAYNRVWHDLSALYSDFHNGGERPAIAAAASGVWKSFLSLKQYADDPQYDLIRDHLRATVKPACADLIAKCSETSGE
jgi:hypothetical protein